MNSNLTWLDVFAILALVFACRYDFHRRIAKIWEAISEVEDRKLDKEL